MSTEQLTIAQSFAAGGIYAAAMAGFIRWLAPRLDEVRAELTALTHERRAKVEVAHDRTADVLAQISATGTVWLKFAVEVGALTRQEADVTEKEVWATLKKVAGEQRGLQSDQNPCERFFELLSSALSSGSAHIACAKNPDRCPVGADDVKALGWRMLDDGKWRSQGACVGWWSPDGIYLNPATAYSEAQNLGASSGEGVGLQPTTLWLRIRDQGILLTTDHRGGRHRAKVRRPIGGTRKDILHVPHVALWGDFGGPRGPCDPEAEKHEET